MLTTPDDAYPQLTVSVTVTIAFSLTLLPIGKAITKLRFKTLPRRVSKSKDSGDFIIDQTENATFLQLKVMIMKSIILWISLKEV